MHGESLKSPSNHIDKENGNLAAETARIQLRGVKHLRELADRNAPSGCDSSNHSASSLSNFPSFQTRLDRVVAPWTPRVGIRSRIVSLALDRFFLPATSINTIVDPPEHHRGPKRCAVEPELGCDASALRIHLPPQAGQLSIARLAQHSDLSTSPRSLFVLHFSPRFDTDIPINIRPWGKKDVRQCPVGVCPLPSFHNG